MKNIGSKIINFHLYLYGICFIIIGLSDLSKLSFFFLFLTGVSLLPPVHTIFRKSVFVGDKSKYYKPFVICLSLVLFFGAINSTPTTSTTTSTTRSNIPEDVTNVESYLNEVNNSRTSITKETITNENGTYIGEMYRSLKHGNGTFTWNDGSIYKGSFVDDLIDGHGTLVYSNKEEYVGEFSYGRKNGYGKYTFSNGDSYTGYWMADVMSGAGTYKFKNGDYYTGYFLNNMFNGQGKYVCNGVEYEGNWENNKFISN